MKSGRRFKKRYLALIVVILLGALVGSAVYRATTAKHGPLIDYHQKLFDLSRQIQGDAPDQWEEFQAALSEAYRQARATEYFDTTGLTALYAGDPSDELLQERGRKLVDALAAEGVFEQTARLARIEVAVRPAQVEGPLHLISLPYLSESRQIARVQAGRMRLSAERGAWDDYLAALEEGLAVSRLVASQTTLIDYLVGVAIEALAIGQAQHDLASGAIDDPAVLDRLLDVMRRQQLPTMAHALEGERMFLLDFIQRVYTDEGNGDGRLILTRIAELDLGGMSPAPAELAQFSIINVAAPLFPSRARTVADLNRLFDAVIAEAGAPAHVRSGGFDADRFVESLPRRQIILRKLAPSVGSISRSADRRDTIRAGVEVLARIERYRLQTGGAPTSLAELAAADADAEIIDPMTGEPFLYTPLTDDPHGRPYLLYTAGADGRDDGGAIHPEQAEKAFMPTGAGSDYVFNPPPREPPGP